LESIVGAVFFLGIILRDGIPWFGRDIHDITSHIEEPTDKGVVHQSASDIQFNDFLACVVEMSEIQFADGQGQITQGGFNFLVLHIQTGKGCPVVLVSRMPRRRYSTSAKGMSEFFEMMEFKVFPPKGT
jgi:hypothetical protein